MSEILSVEFRGAEENPYTVDLFRPDPQGFVINDIQGLGAGTAELFTQGRASMDGDVVNGARLPGRSITFEMGYGRHQHPSDGRQLSYDLFAIKEPIQVVFATAERKVIIDGYVETNEPDIFTNEPGFEVSIYCERPYFRSMDEDQVLTRLYGVHKVFQFPFKNDSLTEKQLVMGERLDQKFVELLYSGNVPNGALFRYIFTGSVTNPSIMSERTGEAMRIDSSALTQILGSGLRAGDIVEINTVRGARSISLIRDGIRRNVLNALSRSSRWITLKRGMNHISVYADGNPGNFQVEIMNDNLYSGL